MSRDELLFIKGLCINQQLVYKTRIHKKQTKRVLKIETTSLQKLSVSHTVLMIPRKIQTTRLGMTRNANVFPLTGLGLTPQFWSTAPVE